MKDERKRTEERKESSYARVTRDEFDNNFWERLAMVLFLSKTMNEALEERAETEVGLRNENGIFCLIPLCKPIALTF